MVLQVHFPINTVLLHKVMILNARHLLVKEYFYTAVVLLLPKEKISIPHHEVQKLTSSKLKCYSY